MARKAKKAETELEIQNKTAPEVAPETAPETAPEVAPETAPEVAPETAPEAAPETAPEAAPETAPEAAPETAPETAPEPAPTPEKKKGRGRPPKSVKKQFEPMPEPIPTPQAPQQKKGIKLSSIVTGSQALTTIDTVVPAITSFLTQYTLKTKIDSSDIAIGENIHTMDDLAQEALNYMDIDVNPVQLLLIGLASLYGTNIAIAVKESRENKKKGV